MQRAWTDYRRGRNDTNSDSTYPQDARFTSIHFTDGHILSLSFDPPPETGWSVMPGFDESIPIPPHLEPPRVDADETLPTQMHPSYPYGRPSGSRKKPNTSVGNLLSTVGGGFEQVRRGEKWDETGMDAVMEPEGGKEVPPGMAVSRGSLGSGPRSNNSGGEKATFASIASSAPLHDHRAAI